MNFRFRMDLDDLAFEEEDNLNYYVEMYFKSLIIAQFKHVLRSIRMHGRARRNRRIRRLRMERVQQYINFHNLD